MSEALYKAVEYGNGAADEAVALVAGLCGPTEQLENAAHDMVASGRDAVIYTYNPAVLFDGDAELLPNCIDTITKDFAERTNTHLYHRYGGVSLGGAIAASMQRHDPDAQPGLYAATGVDAAGLVLRNSAFRAIIKGVHHLDVRKNFEKSGYTLQSLRERWSDIQQPPLSPLTLALGGMDMIVRRRHIEPCIARWRTQNPDITVIRQPLKGHTGMVKWYNQHILSMIEEEDSSNGKTKLYA